MKNRSRLEVIAQILRSATDNGGLTASRIMYKAFLSSKQAREYANALVEDGLLESYPPNRYKTTVKGLQFLQMFEELGQCLDKLFGYESRILPAQTASSIG